MPHLMCTVGNWSVKLSEGCSRNCCLTQLLSPKVLGSILIRIIKINRFSYKDDYSNNIKHTFEHKCGQVSEKCIAHKSHSKIHKIW